MQHFSYRIRTIVSTFHFIFTFTFTLWFYFDDLILLTLHASITWPTSSSFSTVSSRGVFRTQLNIYYGASLQNSFRLSDHYLMIFLLLQYQVNYGRMACFNLKYFDGQTSFVCSCFSLYGYFFRFLWNLFALCFWYECCDGKFSL